MSGLVKWDNNPQKNNQKEQKQIYVYVTAKHQHKQSKYSCIWIKKDSDPSQMHTEKSVQFE